jgi:hypothetical protein
MRDNEESLKRVIKEDKQAEEIRKAEEEVRKKIEAEAELLQKHLKGMSQEEAICEIAKLLTYMRHSLYRTDSYVAGILRDIVPAVQTLWQERAQSKEDKCPVSTTNIDNKDLILEKDDDKQVESK